MFERVARLEVQMTTLIDSFDEHKRTLTHSTRIVWFGGGFLVLHAFGVPTEDLLNIVVKAFAVMLGAIGASFG